jgi:sulfite reductase (NADPH) flavoprotein alpha-component
MTNHDIGRLLTQPLSPDQEELLRQLVGTLSPEQALWVSGFLSGVARQSGMSLSPAAPAAPGGGALTILYASESGNAAAVARSLASAAESRGKTVAIADLADYSIRSLKKETTVLFVSSTHGDGDPPDTAATFFEDLRSKRAPKLDGLSYAVLALGDTSYEFFCEAGKLLDQRLEELGAKRLHDRVDCDVDFEADAEAWTEAVLATVTAGAQPAPAQVSADAAAAFAPQTAYGKANPFSAEVLENIRITGRGSSKIVNHVELSTEGLTYEPGDALGIIPRNDPALVEEVLTALAPASTQTADGTPLAQALEQSYEISLVTPSFLEFWAERSGSDFLAALAEPEARVDRFQYLGQHHVLDLLRAHPAPGLSADEFTGALRKLQPRLYSIASSPAAFADEVHLTVGLLSYDLHGTARQGIASGHVCGRLDVDERLPVYVQRNDNFRLPADNAPAIMISAGTGIAPFRGFMFDRQERGVDARNWLFFGDRKARTDFLYQTEWQAFMKDGLLDRMDVAFSRDQAEKVYIQQRLRESSKELYAWLAEGAHLYVCGSADGMALAVDEALLEIIAKEGGLSPDKAVQELKALQQQKRYQKDVY